MNEVRIEYLRPRQIDVAMSRCPTIFLPIGTIEWHGYHNVTGVDALIAQAMCLRAAERGGGLVHPTHYGAVGGLQEQHTFVFDTERIIDSVFFQPWLEKWCREAVRNGFKSIILLTGHAGAAQQIAVRAAAARMTRILDTPVLGTAAYWLSIDLHINVDHAAFYETSLMIHLYPDTVDLDELGDPPHRGVYGKDPKQFATADAGKRCTDASVERLATLATTMPGWSADQIRAFADAEQAIVSMQEKLASPTGPGWEGWRNVDNGVLDAYPDALVHARFDRIMEIAAGL